jgi:hypothetical protein
MFTAIQSTSVEIDLIHFRVRYLVAQGPSPCLKARKQEQFQDRQRVEQDSNSFVDCHALMNGQPRRSLQDDYLSFVNRLLFSVGGRPKLQVVLGVLPVFPDCSPPRFVQF